MTKDLISIERPHRFLQAGALAIDCGDRELLSLAPIGLRPLPNPREAIAATLAHPEDFPPLADALVPGDSIAIAVDPNLPDLIDCVQGVLDALGDRNVGSIEIVLAEDALPATETSLSQAIGSRATVCRHTPDDRDQLGYLAAAKSAEPIYLNRRILEADFVIPLVTLRPSGGIDPINEAAGIFPAFADRASQQRWNQMEWKRSADSTQKKDGPSENDQDAIETAWMLGIQMIIGVMPTADAHAAEIVAGTPVGIRRRLGSNLESSWRRAAPVDASLIIAIIEGDAQQQNWGNITRAIHTASGLVDPGATIAICSEVADAPDTSLGLLASDETAETIMKELLQQSSPGATATGILLQTREDYRIVLATALPSERIENIGLGVIEDLAGLQRLVNQHDTTIVLRGAQFCAATAVGSEA